MDGVYIDPLVTVLLVGAGIVVGMALAGAAFALRFVNHRLDELEAVLAKRRHTYRTADGLEDGLAVAIDIALNEKAQAEWREIRLRQLRQILGEVREGPLAYNGERPADRPPRPDGRGKQ